MPKADARFGRLAPALAELGYVPIPLHGKRPVVDNWTATEDWPERLPAVAQHFPDANVGIITRGLAALDADVLDEAVAAHMRRFIIRQFCNPGKKFLFRVGRPPKWLCLFRCAEGDLPKRSSPEYEDARGRRHRLEWLRTGQQFLAYGPHPDTGEPVHWPNGDPLATGTRPEDLPAISDADIDTVHAEFARVAEEQGWRLTGRERTAPPEDAQPAAPVAGLTLEHASEALGHYPNDDLHYDEWLGTGMALHHQFEGSPEAFELWHFWSLSSPKCGDESYNWRRWESFDASRPGGISMRSVLQHAEHNGWTRPAGIEAAPAAAEDFPLLDEPAGAAPTPSQAPQTDAADNPASRLPLVALHDLADADLPEPEHIIHPLLPRGVVTLLGAHGGAGKTMLALVQAVCVATGREFMGHETVRAPVVFYSAEDDGDILRWRLQKICRKLDIDPGELVGWLTVYDVTSLNPALYGEGTKHGVRYGSVTKVYTKLREAVAEIGAGLVIVDNASDVFEANENERSRVRGFMRALAKLAAETSGAVELIAHIDKASAKKPGTPEGYSGSTAWHNSARSRLYLRADSLDRLVLEHQKANFSRRAADTFMLWEYGVPVLETPGADDGEGTGTDTWGAYRHAVLGLLIEFYDRGEHIPTSMHAPGNAWKALSGEMGFPTGLSRLAFESLLRDLERAGDVAREDYWSTHRKPRQRWYVTDRGRAAVAEGRPHGVTDQSWLDELEGASGAPSPVGAGVGA